MENIAIFDFDGTITTKDSLNDLLIWRGGYIRFFVIFCIYLPLVILYKIGFINNAVPKMKIFSSYFKGMTEAEFNKIAVRYSKTRLNKIINTEAQKKIDWHLSQGHKVIILSASFGNWIVPWSETHGISDVIASKLKIENGKVAGSIEGKNCYGKNKPDMFFEKYGVRDKYFIYSYGDSKSDRYLFDISDEYYYKKYN
jgi:HAD superfamily hydrolase (TIGR01490 family)